MSYLDILETAQPELGEKIQEVRRGLATLDKFKARYKLEVPPVRVTTMPNDAIGGYYAPHKKELKVYLHSAFGPYYVLLHEAGHAIADKYLDGKMPAGETQVSEKDYPDSLCEREAETLRIFIGCEETLKELNPSRYEYLKSFFPG